MENQLSKEEIQTKVVRLERTLVTLQNSSVKEVRIQFGAIAMTPVCDEVWPIAELKKEYMRRGSYRITELKNELIERFYPVHAEY